MALQGEKLMIVGAGKFQVPVIKLAQKMGFETIAVSVAGNYPGFLVADKSYEVDVREKEEILEIARKENIQGILTDQTDLPVPTVAYVAQEMGLPGVGYECAVKVTDKLKCRQHCQEIGFPIPRFIQTGTLDEATEASQEIGYPLVVKPADSQGSRGVARVDQPDELPRKFQAALSYSAKGIVLLEEFADGGEMILIGFVSGYRHTNLLIGDHRHFDLPDRFIWSRSYFPTSLEGDLRQTLLDLDGRLYESLGPKFGITFSQYKVDRERGSIRLMEAALRGPASLQSSHAVPLVSGVEILPLLVELASGRRQSVEINRSEILSRPGGVAYYYLPEGVVCQTNGLGDVESVPGVEAFALDDLRIGTRIERIQNSTGRKGPIVFRGDDRQACDAVIRRVQETLRIGVRTTDGVEYPIWD